MERLESPQADYILKAAEQGGADTARGGRGGGPSAESSCHGFCWRNRESEQFSEDRNGEREGNTTSCDSSCRGVCSNRWRNCASSHKCTAHSQSRTPRSSTPQGLLVNGYINSKLHLFDGRYYGAPCGMWKRLNTQRPGFLGIIRIILVSVFVVYLCIPTTAAAPRRQPHSSESPNLNQSLTAGVDQLVELLRKELPRSRPTNRRDPRPASQRGRGGRQRSSSRQDQGPLPTDMIYPRISEEFLKSSCQPRDTILDAYHELGIDRGFMQLFPQCIAVKRCKNGGCCLEHQECTATDSVYKTFYFIKNLNSSPISHDVREDTACECVDTCGLSQAECPSGKTLNINTCSCECPKRCPEPFILNDRCECDCLMSNRQCKYFYRGKRGAKLSTSDCNCVWRGDCQVPPCANGVFDRQECMCVNPSS